MEIKVIDLVENEDGSANVELECDKEVIQKAVQFYVTYMLMTCEIKEYKDMTDEEKGLLDDIIA